MNIVERVKNIIVTPKTEWDVIAAENTPPKQVILTYVMPLAVIAAIAGFISSSIIGTSAFGVTVRMPILWGIIMLVYWLVMYAVVVFVLGFIIDALAPSFGGQKNLQQAVKVAAYSYTPGLVGAVFGILPWVGWFLALLAGLYGLYLLYLGLPKLMRNPDDKTVVYEIVVIVVAFIVFLVIGGIASMITAGAMFGSAAMGGAASSSSMAPQVTYQNKQMDEFARKMEEASKKMEAAEKSGDPNKQMEAAMAALGTAMSGGKGKEPVQIDALKPLVPDTFAGLPRKDLRTERGGAAGFMTAKAEGVYGDDSGKNARVEVVDTGGVAGLMGLASWMNVQGEKENAERRESTRREGNRLVHEEQNKKGGSSKYTVVVADRFIVEARGNVDYGQLKSAVNGLDLAKLESLK
jgi:hypothetical protein